MKTLHAPLLLLALLTAQAGAGQSLIEHAHVVPMTGQVVLEGHSVLVRDGLIAAVCAPGASCGDGSAETIDGTGKFLIPGLIDMHAHTNPGVSPNMDEEMRELAHRVQSQQLRQYVMFGVTTLRDTAGGPANLEIRERIARGEAIGPRIFTALGAMDGDPPLHAATTPFATGEEAATHVFNMAAAGYDFVKIYSTLPQPVFNAIVDAASEVGLPVVGHVPMPIDVEYALQRGMRSIEHLSGYDVACAGPEAGIEPIMDDVYQGMNYCTPEKIRQLAEMTTRYDAWNCPTLIVQDNVKSEWDRHTVFNEEEARYTPPMLRIFQEYLYDIFRPRARAGLKAARIPRMALVKALSDAGAPLLLGTDTAASGYNVHQELALLVESGLTPYQALTAATSEPARYFERVGEFGTIVPGGSADLVLLDANPLEDVANARGIAGVMLRGDWWPRPRIEKELAAIQDEYARDAEILARQSIGEVP
ncbi:MAG: amidohydrolase family protein [Gammaproteobacteria bacterium]|nr:amidohydrolase family protein [Gammaproteobacteria bacterium]